MENGILNILNRPEARQALADIYFDLDTLQNMQEAAAALEGLAKDNETAREHFYSIKNTMVTIYARVGETAEGLLRALSIWSDQNPAPDDDDPDDQ